MVFKHRKRRKKVYVKDGRRMNGGARNNAGRPVCTDPKTEIKYGLRSKSITAIDEHCHNLKMTRRELTEHIMNIALFGYYGIPDEKTKAIVETAGMPLNEVVAYLLKKASS